MIGFKSKIYVAGHKGLVGSSIFRKLKEKGYKNIICVDSKKKLIPVLPMKIIICSENQ